MARALDEVRGLLEQHRTDAAFLRLWRLVGEAEEACGAVAGQPAEAGRTRQVLPIDLLRRLCPLLGCFLPHTATRVWDLLGAAGPLAAANPALARPFPAGHRLGPREPLFAQERLNAKSVQLAYQKLVDERRAGLSLREEVTDARADALCVCPLNLKEQ